MSNPTTRNIEAYFGNTYGLVYVFENSAGAAFDIASNFDTASLKIFTKDREASPLVELTLGNGLTISDTNRLLGEITPAQNVTLFGSPIKYYQLTVTYNGDTETILKGIYVVNRAQSGSANDTALTLTVSLAPLEVSVSVADNAFLALQAKNETQEIVSQVSPSRAGISYATKVDMDNDTTQINGTTGIVANDTAANNGFYRWNAIAWVKRDNFYATVLDPTNESEAVTGKAVSEYTGNNLWVDPFFQETDYEGSFSSLLRWGNTASGELTSRDGFGARRININLTGTVSTFLRIVFDMEMLGLSVGDTFRIDAFAQSVGARVRQRIRFLDVNGDLINELIGSNVSNITSRTRINLSDEIPLGTKEIEIQFDRGLTDDELFIDGLIITNKDIKIIEPKKEKGKIIQGVESVAGKNRTKLYDPKIKYINELELIFSGAENYDTFKTDCSINKNSKIPFFLDRKPIEISSTASVATCKFTFNSKSHEGNSCVMAWVYIHDSNELTGIGLKIIGTGGEQWLRTANSNNPKYIYATNEFNNGWNLLRFDVRTGVFTNFGVATTAIELIISSTSGTKIDLACVIGETPSKAKLLLVQDGGYYEGWLDNHTVTGQIQGGVSDCDDRNLPITWALNPKRFIDGSVDGSTMTIAELKDLQERISSRFSFHSYDRESLGGFTLLELKNDSKNSINWLQANGLGKPNFRAAFTQNNAPEGVYTINFMGLNSLATSTGKSGSISTFPFVSRKDIPRYLLHRSNYESEFDTMFEALIKTRGIVISYTHKIQADDEVTSGNLSLSAWQYFLSKVDTAVLDNDLELVSYEDLTQKLLQCGIEDNDYSIKEAILAETLRLN